MTSDRVRSAARLAMAAAIAASVAACGGSAASVAPPTPPLAGDPSPTPVASPSAAAGRTPSPSLTPVPGAQSNAPDPAGSHIPTTQTDWGEIVDAVPDTFPIYPDASPAEISDEVVSGSFEAPVGVDALVGWYTEQLTERGYAVDTGDALEDGSRVMDVMSDIPECRLQLAARPADGSTIMTVLVASACVNGTG